MPQVTATPLDLYERDGKYVLITAAKCAPVRFRRSLTLPADIDANDVDATLSKGVLTVTLTPSKPIAAKRVAIKTT